MDIHVLNTISGKTAWVPEKMLNHPVLGKSIVVVDADQKDYEPSMYQPKTVEEFNDKSSKRKSNAEPVESPVDETEVV